MKKEIKHNSFVTYATTVEEVEKLYESNPQQALQTYRAIALHGIYGEASPLLPHSITEEVDMSSGHEVDIVQLKKNGLTHKQIADKLHCSTKTVQRRLKKLGGHQVDKSGQLVDTNWTLGGQNVHSKKEKNALLLKDIKINHDITLQSVQVGEYSDAPCDLYNIKFGDPKTATDPLTGKGVICYTDVLDREFIYRTIEGKKLIYRLK